MDKIATFYELLTKGITYNTNVPVSILNKKLRFLKYEAVLWFDKSCIILKDLDDQKRVSYSCKHQLVLDSMNIIEEIIKNGDKNTSGFSKDALNFLKEKAWIEKVDEEKYILGKRFLVQNEDYLLSICKTYTKCKFCDLLVKDLSSHTYCENIYADELKTQENKF